MRMRSDAHVQAPGDGGGREYAANMIWVATPGLFAPQSSVNEYEQQQRRIWLIVEQLQPRLPIEVDAK